MKFEDFSRVGDPSMTDYLLEVTPVVVSVLIRGRNAWHSTWVRNWFRNSHLFSDHASAQRGAEPLRAQGSVFYVNDVPGLLFSGAESSLVAVDGIQGSPFQAFQGMPGRVVTTDFGTYLAGMRPGIRMHEAVGVLGSDPASWGMHYSVSGSLRLGAVPAEASLARIGTSALKATSSYPLGSGFLLGWSSRTQAIDSAPAERHALAWEDLIAGTGLSCGSSVEDQRAMVQLLGELRQAEDTLFGTAATVMAAYESALVTADLARREGAEAERMASAQVDAAESAYYEAEEFADDPWGQVLSEAQTAAGVRAARERALNAVSLRDAAEAAWDQAIRELSKAAQGRRDSDLAFASLLGRRPRLV